MADAKDSSFLARNEFLIRRLHSLSGLIPVGAYMVVHLVTNASLLDGAGTFQRAVFGIHSLGDALPIVEWVFIFIPILFHAIVGVVIIAGSVPNTTSYPYGKNYRYYAQRATGMIGFAFIMYHVFQTRGWIHNGWWMEHFTRPLGGAEFYPYNAASTLGMIFQGSAAALIWIIYLIGVLSLVFHLANGIWTMGITWGVWISPAAQQRASNVCMGFGVLLAIVGLTAIYAAATVDVPAARAKEETMLKENIKAGYVKEDPHKVAPPLESSEISQVDASGKHKSN